MTYPRLETERLQLIELNKSHASTLQISRDDVTRYYGIDPFVEVEQAEKMIQSFSTNIERKQSIRWGLQVKETEELVGTIGLNNLKLWSKKCEVGYDLHPDYWNKGYIKGALRAVLPYCFEELNLSRVNATTFPANKASWQLLLKVEFVKEGLLRNYLYQGSQKPWCLNVFNYGRRLESATRIIRKRLLFRWATSFSYAYYIVIYSIWTKNRLLYLNGCFSINIIWKERQQERWTGDVLIGDLIPLITTIFE